MPSAREEGQAGPEPEAKWWEAAPEGSQDGGGIRCLLCPHLCRLRPGQTGLCRIRCNREGRMALPFYGRLSALALDPMEKKPLHHFKPGTRILSAGFYGCNLACPFCQNWTISQEVDEDSGFLSPKGLVAEALKAGSPSLAFTYSEPSIHFEYLLEAADAAQAAGIATVLVTNGCLNEGPGRELMDRIDAANIDLKCFSPEGYARILKGDLKTVENFIAMANEKSLVEVTTLVVPGFSDNEEGIRGISGFLASIDPDIPLHLSAYHPAFRYSAPATEEALMLRLTELAREKLRYVYAGNLGGFPADTYCPSCGALLVRRRGYSVSVPGLEEAGPDALKVGRNTRLHAVQSRCRKCKSLSPIMI